MSQNNIQFNPSNSAAWLAACGFIFPSDESELRQFDALHGEIDSAITGNEVNPFNIIRNNTTVMKKPPVKPIYIPVNELRLVAARPSEPPAHVVKRAKNNEENNTL